MSTQLESNYEIQDHNVAAGYVTLIVDIWNGPLNDPATAINRYIGVWDENHLKNGVDGLDFSQAHRQRYSSSYVKPTPMVWEKLDSVRAADEEAKRAKNDEELLLPGTPEQDRYMPYGMRQTANLYQQFLEAIDVLAEDRENAEAWAAVAAWRQHSQLKHEK